MARMMKAANLYAPGDIRAEEVPVPEPKEGRYGKVQISFYLR